MAQTIKLKRSGTQNAVPTTSQLALGEVALNTYDGKMYIKKSVGGTESIVEIGGDATSSSGLDFTGNLNLEDNVRIVIGDGSDLQIYHDGSDSIINENGVGDLKVFSSRFRVISPAGEEMIRATADGAVDLYHNNSAKFATTSSGISVTGDISLSGNIVDSDQNEIINIDTNDIVFNGKHVQSAYGVWVRRGGVDTNRKAGIDSNSQATLLQFYTNSTEYMRIDADGRLLVNTTSSIDNLAKIQVVGDSSSLARITLQDVDGTNQKTYFEQSGGGTRISTQDGTSNGFFTIGAWNGTASSDFVRVDSTGRVGIGTVNPSEKLHVDGNIRLQGTNSLVLNTNGSLRYSSSAGAVLLSNGSSEDVKIRTVSNANAGDIILETDEDERIRILGSNGNVGIGTTTPDFKLDVTGSAGAFTAGDNIIGVFQSATDHATYLKVKNKNTNTTAGATRAGIDLDVANHADSARARAQFVLRSITGADVGGDTNISVPRDLRFLINNESTLTDSSGEQASSAVVAGTEIMRIASTGNVGIGNTSPGEKLEVTGTIKQTGSYNLTLSGGANITGSNHLYIKGNNSYVRIDAPSNSIYYNAGTDHVFGNGNGSTEYMRIDTNGTNAGNVGIGISAPSTPLAVQSNSSAQGISILGRSSDDISQLDFNENDGTSIGGFQARTTDFRIRSVQNLPLLFMTNNTERVRIHNNGQLGIGVTNFTSALRGNGKQLIIGSCFVGTGAALVVDDFARFAGALYIHEDAGGNSANLTSIDNNGSRLVITGKAGTTANALDAPDGFYVGGTQFITSSRQITNVTSITATGAISTTGTASLGAINVGSSTSGNVFFKRPNANYIFADQSGGYLVFGTNGRSTSVANSNFYLGTNQDVIFQGSISVASNVTSSGSFTSSQNQQGFRHIAPDVMSGHTSRNEMAFSWTGDETRWYMFPTVDGSANFGRELSFDYSSEEWSIEGPVTLSSLSTTASAVSSFAGPLTVGGTTLGNAFEFQVNGDARITGFVEAGSAQLGNTTLTGFLRGPSTFTIDPATHGDDTGTVVIAGNLQVDGTTTTINSTTLTVDDKNITLASGSTNKAAANGAGLTVDCGSDTDATFTYNGTNDQWELNKILKWDYALATTALHLNNNNIVGVNNISFADPGGNEGLQWTNIKLFESPNDLTNTSGNLQVTYGGTRRFTVDNTGIDVVGKGKFRGTADGVSVLELGQLDNDANTALFTVYTDDGGSARPFGGDALDFNTPRYGQQIGATRGSAAGGNVRSWNFGTTTNGNERGIDLLIYSQGDSSATGSTGTSANVQISATSNRNSYINTSGNFGLGTNSPTHALHLVRSSASSEILVESDTGYATLKLDAASGAGSGVRLLKGGTEKVRLQSEPTSHDLSIRMSGTPKVTLTQAGSFGIGTDSPNALLHVKSTGNGEIEVERASGALINLQAQAALGVIGTDSNHNLAFKVNGQQQARLTTSGRFGIGTTSPSTKLHIVDSATPVFRIEHTGGTARYVDIYNSSGTMYLRARNDTANGPIIFQGGGGGTNTEYARFQSTGYLGVGTTGPSRRLHVKDTNYNVARLERDGSGGGVALELRNGDGNIWQVSNDGDEVLRFYYATNNRFQVTSTGAATFNNAFTFPTTDGSANQVLKTDGSGNVTWATEAAVSASTSISDADGDTRIQTEESSDEDQIRFDAAGVERFRIGSDVQVIGTTDFNVTGSNRRISFTSGTGTVQTTGASSLHLGTNNTNRVTIDSSGNVGIGTTAPTGTLQLGDASSSVDIVLHGPNNTAASSAIYFGDHNTDDAPGYYGISLKHNTTANRLDIVNENQSEATSGELMSIMRTSGNVGIGTIAPSAPLHVVGSDSGIKISSDASDRPHLSLVNGTSEMLRLSANNVYGAIGDSTDSQRYMTFVNGSIGIGTTNPGAKVTIVKSTNATNGVIIQNATTGTAARSNLRLLSDAAQLDIYATSSTYSGVSSWADAGVISTSSNASGGLIFNAQATGHIFQTSTTERMRINSSGNVGIGTSSPGQKLTVRGATELSVGDVGTKHATEFNWVKSNTGSSGNGVWYKVADISLSAISYSAISFEAYYETGLNNFGSHNYLDVREVFVSIVRNSTATLNNSPDSATLRGRTSDIRVYKTAVGTYELQARHNSQNAKYAVRVRVFQTNGGTITPKMDGSTAGTTSGGTEYTVAEPATTEGVRRYLADIDSSRIHLGSSDLYPSGNGLYVHYSGSGFIPSSTTASSNGSLGTSTYLWNGVFSRRFQGEVGTAGVPTFTFSEDSNTGIYDEWYDQSNSLRQLSFTVDGTRRLHVNQAGVWAAGNFYLPSNGGSLRSFHTYTEISNGTSGNGFRMRNSADNVDSLIVTSAGNGTFAGSLTVNDETNIGHATIDTNSTTTSATTQVAIDTMAAATFRSAEFTIQVTNSTDSTYHMTKVLLIHDGTTPGITEYGTVFTGSAAEATFDADISSGNVRLLATPASTDSMTFKVVRHCITV